MINQGFVTWGEGGAGVRGRQELLVTRQEFFRKKLYYIHQISSLSLTDIYQMLFSNYKLIFSIQAFVPLNSRETWTKNSVLTAFILIFQADFNTNKLNKKKSIQA